MAIALFLQSSASIAFGAETMAQPAIGSSLISLLQVLLGLGLVLGAIAGTAWLLRKLSPGQVAASGSLRVVGGVAIGPKERVVLVDVGDVRLVLGVAPGHVSTLHQMPRPHDELPVEDVLSGTFLASLKERMTRKAAP